ncbi:MAG: glutamine synthetase III [Oscillospiraceae bacterium]|nr:glutamine synthetase III [Oscillospiraceae bacterium]
MKKVPEYFGCNVFDDRAMRSALPAGVYNSLKKTIEEGTRLDSEVAEAVASAMKDWAVEKGATHFTHWFQPLTGITAEKHDSFIEYSPDGGVIMEFSGKELIQGEPDASSLPSGGLRATFEARGYTAWDPTSYAFVRGKTLFIPTAFCSYTGEALDKKTPLLRSMDALNREAMRMLRLFGNTTAKRVSANVGAEQEYFLIPKDLYEKREDLRYTGRTLFGAPSPKSQELDDHYFGSIPSKKAAFMEELNERLWELGIAAKTEHNEVAPSQHELACIYNKVNIATDQNQLVMEIMKKTAEKHGFVCLLHEKPFAGVNGSGKHNNWSICTDDGVNLLSPGSTPEDNLQFLLFLCAVLRAVDRHQDLLRLSVATASNDNRLGGNEAPPAVISVFLGDEITGVLEAVAEGIPYERRRSEMMKIGSEVLPGIRRDNTDRNRTSPFAFTGNKFEFRMVGSSDSIACANIMLNSSVAESLGYFADELEKAESFEDRAHELISETYHTNGRIIFNGNGYVDEWKAEAERRGLLNYRTTPDCMPHLLDKKNVELLTKLGVYTESELRSRCEIMLENYCKTVEIEARTMESMAIQRIAPAVERYAGDLAQRAMAKTAAAGAESIFEMRIIEKLSKFTDGISDKVDRIKNIRAKIHTEDWEKEAYGVRDELIPAMEALRADCDAAEEITAKDYWPFPTYGDLLFGS